MNTNRIFDGISMPIPQPNPGIITEGIPMNRIVSSICLLSVVSLLEPKAEPGTFRPNRAGVSDPRTHSAPVIRLHHREPAGDNTLFNALLISAHMSVDAETKVNTLVGMEGAFTDEQIIAGITRFYQEWRPNQATAEKSPPSFVLAVDNWGVGNKIWTALDILAKEHHFDVYEMNIVAGDVVSTPDHPTPNDKRLAELIKAGAAGKP